MPKNKTLIKARIYLDWLRIWSIVEGRHGSRIMKQVLMLSPQSRCSQKLMMELVLSLHLPFIQPRTLAHGTVSPTFATVFLYLFTSLWKHSYKYIFWLILNLVKLTTQINYHKPTPCQVGTQTHYSNHNNIDQISSLLTASSANHLSILRDRRTAFQNL